MTALLEQHQHYANVRKRLFSGVEPAPKPRLVIDVKDRIYRPNERLPMVRARIEQQQAAKPRRRDILNVASVDFVPDTPVRRIIVECCQKHEITMAELLGPQRFKGIVLARQEAAYRLSKETRLSMPQIGQRLGNRDHTTILHAIRRHAARLAGAEYRPRSPKALK